MQNTQITDKVNRQSSLPSATNPLAPKRIFIISDEAADLTYIYQYFKLTSLEEEATCLRIEIFQFFSQTTRKMENIELYFFPRHRQIKQYCGLYLEILDKPNLIIYAMDVQTSLRQTIQWLNLLQEDPKLKISFFSSASTYLQRHQILLKINHLFINKSLDQAFFPNFNNKSFQICMQNINKVGTEMENYQKIIPAISKLKWLWKKITNWRKWSKVQQEQLVV